MCYWPFNFPGDLVIVMVIWWGNERSAKHPIQLKDAYLNIKTFTAVILWINNKVALKYNLAIFVCVTTVGRCLCICCEWMCWQVCLTEMGHAQDSYHRGDVTQQIYNHIHMVAIIHTVLVWISNSFVKEHNSPIIFFSP